MKITIVTENKNVYKLDLPHYGPVSVYRLLEWCVDNCQFHYIYSGDFYFDWDRLDWVRLPTRSYGCNQTNT